MPRAKGKGQRAEGKGQRARGKGPGKPEPVEKQHRAGRGTLRPYHHGDLRHSLVAAGVALIEEKGVQALTLREIGARLGVSRSAAYRHFADKAALLDTIAEAGFVEFGRALREARDGAGPDFASRLDAMGLAYVRFAARRRTYYHVMFGVAPTSQPSEAGARAFALLADTIREGQASGDVAPGDPVAYARVVWSQVHGIATLGCEDLNEGGAGTRFVRFSGAVLRAGMRATIDGP